jgi:hypothetical protein
MPATSFPIHRIRLQSDVAQAGSIIDRRTRTTIRVPRASHIRFEIGLFTGLGNALPTSDDQAVAPTGYTLLRLNVQSTLGTNLITKTASTFATPTAAAWNTDTTQTCSILLNDAETDIDTPGFYNIALTATVGATTFNVGSGEIEIFDDFSQNGAGSPPASQAYVNAALAGFTPGTPSGGGVNTTYTSLTGGPLGTNLADTPTSVSGGFAVGDYIKIDVESGPHEGIREYRLISSASAQNLPSVVSVLDPVPGGLVWLARL